MDKLYDFGVAFIDLYKKIAGDLGLGEKIDGYESYTDKDPPEMEGFLYTYWVASDKVYDGEGWVTIYTLHGVRGELPKKPENYGKYS